jgi:hypothetical protein
LTFSMTVFGSASRCATTIPPMVAWVPPKSAIPIGMSGAMLAWATSPIFGPAFPSGRDPGTAGTLFCVGLRRPQPVRALASPDTGRGSVSMRCTSGAPRTSDRTPATTSLKATPRARSRSGSVSTTSSWAVSPTDATSATPGIAASAGRSSSSCSCRPIGIAVRRDGSTNAYWKIHPVLDAAGPICKRMLGGSR